MKSKKHNPTDPFGDFTQRLIHAVEEEHGVNIIPQVVSAAFGSTIPGTSCSNGNTTSRTTARETTLPDPEIGELTLEERDTIHTIYSRALRNGRAVKGTRQVVCRALDLEDSEAWVVDKYVKQLKTEGLM